MYDDVIHSGAMIIILPANFETENMRKGNAPYAEGVREESNHLLPKVVWGRKRVKCG